MAAGQQGNPTTSALLQRPLTRLLAVFLALFNLLRENAVVLARAFINLALVPRSLAFCLELVATGAELRNRLLGKQLLQRPFLNVLLLVLFQLRDELHSPLEDGALVLLAPRNDLGQFIDPFIDCLATATLHCSHVSQRS